MKITKTMKNITERVWKAITNTYLVSDPKKARIVLASENLFDSFLEEGIKAFKTTYPDLKIDRTRPVLLYGIPIYLCTYLPKGEIKVVIVETTINLKKEGGDFIELAKTHLT